nr:hypothetical protein [Tanacetum cinerariifolium]
VGMKDEAKNVPHLRGQKLSRQAKASKPGTCKWEPAGKENVKIKLDDMSKLVKDVTVDTIELDSLKDYQPFMVEDDDEEEVHAESHIKTKDASLSQPLPSLKTIKIQELSTQLLLFSLKTLNWRKKRKMRKLPSKFDEISRAVIDLIKYVEGGN